MNVRTFDLFLVKGMKTKSFFALLLAPISMAPAAVIPATSYNDSRNARNTEPAKLLAVLVVDTEDNAVTTPDHAGGSR